MLDFLFELPHLSMIATPPFVQCRAGIGKQKWHAIKYRELCLTTGTFKLIMLYGDAIVASRAGEKLVEVCCCHGPILPCIEPVRELLKGWFFNSSAITDKRKARKDRIHI